MWFHFDIIPTLCRVLYLPFWTRRHREQNVGKRETQLRLTSVFLKTFPKFFLNCWDPTRCPLLVSIPPSLACIQFFWTLAYFPSLAFYAGAREPRAFLASAKVQMWFVNHLCNVWSWFSQAYLLISLSHSLSNQSVFRIILRVFVVSYILSVTFWCRSGVVKLAITSQSSVLSLVITLWGL